MVKNCELCLESLLLAFIFSLSLPSFKTFTAVLLTWLFVLDSIFVNTCLVFWTLINLDPS